MPAEDAYPGDAWDACVSDDGAYHQFGESPPSSIGRVVAFEEIADLLWRQAGAIAVDNFIDAQILYGEDGGVGSRVVRRYDSHIPAPEGANCRDENAGEMWPEYCVGPAAIEPVILAAFDAAIMGEAPRENARRIEAGLLWFYYVSTFKEANSCVAAAKDCDSSWAYYSGGEQIDGGLGLAGVIRGVGEAGVAAHEAIFQGILAVQCWRDLDPGETAEDADLMARAHGQLDRALDHGLALVLGARIAMWAEAGDAAPEHWAFLQVLGPVIDRAAQNVDADLAAELAALFAGTAADFDAARAVEILAGLFPCP